MTRPTLTIAAIAAVVFSVVVMCARPAHAARPGNEFQLLTQLNGQPVRWTLPDGGRSGIYGATPLCMALRGGTVTGASGSAWGFVPSTVVLESTAPVNLCVRASAASPSWDGGCNTIDTDENFGVPLQGYTVQGVTLDSNATAICVDSDAGTARVTVWGIQ